MPQGPGSSQAPQRRSARGLVGWARNAMPPRSRMSASVSCGSREKRNTGSLSPSPTTWPATVEASVPTSTSVCPCTPSTGWASRLLWSVMARKSSPARWAASTTRSGVPPPSDIEVWTWMTPATRVKPSAGSWPSSGNGANSSTETAYAPKRTASPHSAIRRQRFSILGGLGGEAAQRR